MKQFFKAEQCNDPYDQFFANIKRNTKIFGATLAVATTVVLAAKFNQKLNEWP